MGAHDLWTAAMPTDARARDGYRHRGIQNLSRMGHCAPAVVRTLLDVTGAGSQEWLVRLAAGLPGGIGNTRAECGGVTAALLLLGLRHGGRAERGLPVVIEQGHAYCARFRLHHGSLRCDGILGDRRVPWPCALVVRGACECLADTLADGPAAVIPEPEREAYRRAAAHLDARGFHCAHAVLRWLERVVPLTPAVLDATAGFVGGTLLMGGTCSALAAGVMALGLGDGDIERSRSRVARMLVTMVLGGDALADHLNRFNPTMNRGHALAAWFAAAFGSTQCRALTGCAFCSEADVERFIEEDRVARCEEIAAAVAARVEATLRGVPSSVGGDAAFQNGASG